MNWKQDLPKQTITKGYYELSRILFKYSNDHFISEIIKEVIYKNNNYNCLKIHFDLIVKNDKLIIVLLDNKNNFLDTIVLKENKDGLLYLPDKEKNVLGMSTDTFLHVFKPTYFNVPDQVVDKVLYLINDWNNLKPKLLKQYRFTPRLNDKQIVIRIDHNGVYHQSFHAS